MSYFDASLNFLSIFISAFYCYERFLLIEKLVSAHWFLHIKLILYPYCSFSSQEYHTGEEKKRVYVPRVEDKNSHMRMLKISSIKDLIANSMNILEPSPIDADGSQREDGKFLTLTNN